MLFDKYHTFLLVGESEFMVDDCPRWQICHLFFLLPNIKDLGDQLYRCNEKVFGRCKMYHVSKENLKQLSEVFIFVGDGIFHSLCWYKPWRIL